MKLLVKNSCREAPQSIFLIGVVCFLTLFSMSFVSAFDFDNVKEYDEETKTITVKNCDLWILTCLNEGDKIADVQLKTPQENQVGLGYQKVAEYTINLESDTHDDPFNKMEFYDARNMNEKEINFDYKYKTYEQIEVDDETCTNKNGTNICSKNGSHFEQREIWNDLSNKDLVKGNITIGIFTTTHEGDYVEWIPTLFGVEIEEWATWSATLGNELILYYSLDESGGVDFQDNVTTEHNGTAFGGATLGATGLIGFGMDVNNASEYGRLNNSINLTTGASWNFWYNPDTSWVGTFFSKRTPTNNWQIYSDGTTFVALIWGLSTTICISDNVFFPTSSWTMTTVTYNGSHIGLWKDGVHNKSCASTGTITNTYSITYFGFDGTASHADGQLDEVGIWNRSLTQAEITELYNNGAGLAYGASGNLDVTLNTPADNTLSSTSSTSFNISGVRTGGSTIVNMSLWTNESGNWLERNITTGLTGSEETETWVRDMADGHYVWGGLACDNVGSCARSVSNYTLTVDTTFPSFNVESPTGTYAIGTIGNNESLNTTITDINLDACLYDYNGTNISIPNCLTGVKNWTNFTLEFANTDMIIWANDTTGNVNSTSISWVYNITEVSQTRPETSVESATEEYTVNVTYNSTAFGVIAGTLNLNGTEYAGTSSGSGDYLIFSADAIMPIVDTTTNVTSFWTIDLTDAGGTNSYNLTSYNVSIEEINMSFCGEPLLIPFWNFTILNESNEAEINTTFEATFTVRATGSAEESEFSFSNTTEINSSYHFCMSPADGSYNVDASIKLTRDGYVDKFYNYESVDVDNTTREDDLYMLLATDSTSFIVHAVYVDATDVIGAEVRVQRYYPGSGEWLTTEILTTNEVGTAVGHFLSEDADYRFRVYLSGISIYNSTSTKIVCAEAPCTVTLIIPITVPTGIEEVEDLTSTLTFNTGTNVFTYTYSDTSGIFDNARLHVKRIFPSNGTEITPCNETKSDASGVLTCDISSQTNGTYQASGYITRTSEFLRERINGKFGMNIYNAFGLDGVLWSIFVFIGIVMVGIKRPSLAIIFGTLGLITLSLIGILNVGAVSIVAISSIAIILLMRVGKE